VKGDSTRVPSRLERVERWLAWCAISTRGFRHSRDRCSRRTRDFAHLETIRKQILDLKMDAKQEEARSLTVAEYVAEALVSAGVTHVFGGHGGTVIPLINAICAHPNLEWIYMRNENSASLAAAAQAKLTGKLSCCVATSGPGATNLTTGLVAAAKDKVRVIAITGMKLSWKVDHADFQDCDQTDIFRSGGLQFSSTVMNKAAVVPLLRNAIAVAYEQHTAVHLAIPEDIQAETLIRQATGKGGQLFMNLHRLASVHPAGLRYGYDANSGDVESVCPRALKEAACVLNNARSPEQPRPRIIIGVGSMATGASEAILQLAEYLNAPIVTQLDAKGMVNESHPLVVGVLGIFGNPGLEAARTIVETSDLAICIGVSEAMELLAGHDGLQRRQMIQVEPDEIANAGFGWQAEAKLFGPVGTVLRALKIRLENSHSQKTNGKFTFPDGTEHFTPQSLRDASNASAQQAWDFFLSGRWKEQMPKVVGTYFGSLPTLVNLDEGDAPWKFKIDHEERPGFCHPMRVFNALGPMLKSDSTIAIDTGDSTLWASLALCLTGHQRVLVDLALGTMGYSICASIAAGVTNRDSQVVCIVGDGAIQMTIGELIVAKQMKLKHFLVIVVNNGLLGRVHYGWEGVQGDTIDVPDFVAVAKAYGGSGARISHPEEIAPVLEEGLGHEGLYLIEVMEDPAMKAPMVSISPDVDYFA